MTGMIAMMTAVTVTSAMTATKAGQARARE